MTMTEHFQDPNDWLIWEFKNRKSRNPKYSLRSFARALEISPGRTSEYLSKKRKLTLNMGKRILKSLELSQEEASKFLDLLEGTTIGENDSRIFMNPQIFNLVSEPLHFYILSLIETDDFQSDHKWMARRLGVNIHDINKSIDSLLKTNIVEIIENEYRATQKSLKTSHDIPSAALRVSHRQTIMEAADSLDEIQTDLRDITSMTMAIDMTKLTAAKAEIKKFRRALADKLESGKKTEVYNLNIQLVPVSHIKDKK